MIAIVFPGQGSQKPGMGKELVDAFPAAASVFDEVSSAISQDMRCLCWETDEDTLRQTQNAQLALYTCGVAAWEALRSRTEIHPIAMAGHSVGEYAALTAAGVLRVQDGALLVQRRGDLMSRAGNLRPGTMAAVLGLERDALDEVCREASQPDSVAVIGNDNCPGQLVISGDKDAVARAGEIASSRGAKRVLPLNVSGAFHSPLMNDSAEAMAEALEPALFRSEPAHPRVYSNVTAERVDGATPWPDLLESQLRSPVRWTESVSNMIRDGVTIFIECGGGEVLSALIKRVSRDVQTLSVGDVASLEKTMSALTPPTGESE